MKRTSYRALLCAGMVATATITPAHGAPSNLPEGAFGTGTASGTIYRHWPNATRHAYIVGVIDGMYFAPVVGGQTSFVASLGDCLEGLGVEQETAVVDKAVADDPAHWDGPMNWFVYQALYKFCQGRGKPLAPYLWK